MRILAFAACILIAVPHFAAGAEPHAGAGGPAGAPAKASVATSSKEPVHLAFHRLAVISSKEAEQAGMGDLVTVELSKVKDLELVERDQLDAATKELQLAAVMESQAAASRLKLGRLLKADALLLLSLEGSGKSRSLKVVVCECLCGARLRIERLPWMESEPAELARREAAIVGETREHFAGGIRQIIGVSPFVSKNLLHDYDPLQAGFARLLEGTLTALPNVAVIEFEEARAIGSELALANSELGDRPVPLLVEGEFAVSRAAPGKSEEIQFDLKCLGRGGQTRAIRPPPMLLSDAGRYITGDLPRLIMLRGDVAMDKAIPTEEQVRWLTARAAVFSQAGAWDYAAELLEAALLLTPDDVELRLNLMANYERCPPQGVPLEKFVGSDLQNGPAVQAALRESLRARLATQTHLEFLIRNRRLDRFEAIVLTKRYTGFGITRFVRTRPAFKTYREEWLVAKEAHERFMIEVYPGVLTLADREWRPHKSDRHFPGIHLYYGPDYSDFCRRWQNVYSTSIYTKHDLDYLFRVLTQIIPDRLEANSQIGYLFADPGIAGSEPAWKSSVITADQWVEFLGRLNRSQHRMASLYGLLWWKWNSGDRSPKSLQGLRADVGEWLKDYAAMEFATPTQVRRVNEDTYKCASDLQRQIDQALKPPVAKPNPPPQPMVSGPRVQPKVVDVPADVARLRCQEIALQVRRADGETVPYEEWARYRPDRSAVSRILACGPHLDVFWGENALLLLREKGLLEEIPACAKGGFLKLYWDGRNVWMVTRERGIWVMSPAGKVLAKIGAELGLPPGDRGMFVYPLEPGKVCAVGSFGPDYRGWCAMIEFGQDGAKVNVFHRATHVPLPDSGKVDRKDLECVFNPLFLHEYDPGQGKPSLLLVEGSGPLTINPRTLEVSKLGIHPYPSFHGKSQLNEWYFNREGDVIGCGINDSPIQFAHPGATFDDDPMSLGRRGYRSQRMFQNDHTMRPLLVKGNGRPVTGNRLIEYQGWIYVPGLSWQTGNTVNNPPWYRINAKTFEAEILVWERRAPRYVAGWGVSSHYGLVALPDVIFRPSPAPLVQVTIVEPLRQASLPGEKQKSAPSSVQPKDTATATAVEPKPKSKSSPAAVAKLRTWHAAAGHFSVDAAFESANAGMVMLRKADNSTILVPVEKLSDEDRQFIRGRSQ